MICAVFPSSSRLRWCHFVYRVVAMRVKWTLYIKLISVVVFCSYTNMRTAHISKHFVIRFDSISLWMSQLSYYCSCKMTLSISLFPFYIIIIFNSCKFCLFFGCVTVCLSVWICVSFVCCLVDFLPSNSLFNRIAVFSLDDGNGWRKPFTCSKRQQSHIFIIIYNGSSENQWYLILFHIDGLQGESRWLLFKARQLYSIVVLGNLHGYHNLVAIWS